MRAAAGAWVMTGAEPAAVLPDLASALLTQSYPSLSLWSAVVHGTPRLMLCPGLPQGPSVPALFDLTAPLWQEALPI